MNKANLEEVLSALRANSAAAWRGRYDRLVAALKAANVGADAAKVGDRIENFMLPATSGRLVDLDSLLAKGPLVLSFYRGAWCTYCSAELEALNAAVPAIRAAGANLVAITAEAGEIARETREKRALDFEILADLDNGVALELGLVYQLSEEVRAAYLAIGRDFSAIYGNDNWYLPIPATYIVGADGKIRHAFVEPDFRFRWNPEEIVKCLQAMK